MKPLLITCILLSTVMASCQVHWQEASDWTMYSYQGYLALKLPADSLKQYKHLRMNQDSMMAFVTSAQRLARKDPFVWMGGYIATCNLDGTLRKIDLSSYGGFFYDEKSSTYYQMSPEKTDSWLSFLKNSYLILVTGNH